MIADALKLSVYFGESLTIGPALAADDLLRRLAGRGLAGVALLRGIEGFGINRRIHAERFPDLSTDLPLLAIAVDTAERIRGVLDDVDLAVPRGLVTLESARLATGDDVARAEFPDGPGRAAKLTIYCRRGRAHSGRPAYREAVALLRRHGATGAIVFPGVDGVLEGRRGRARLFGANGNAPMVIISVGPAELLHRSLPHLHEVLARPFVTLERIAQLKHDGDLLELPPRVQAGAGLDVWQTIRVYTRRTAQVHGRPLYSELARRLRREGAAGATTILGDWGFSSDEPPHGDILGRVREPPPDVHGLHRPPRQGRGALAADRRADRRARDRHLAARPGLSRAGRRDRTATSSSTPRCRPRGGPSSRTRRNSRPAANGRRGLTRCSRGCGSSCASRASRAGRARDARGRRAVLPAGRRGRPGADMVTLHPYADRYDAAPPRAVIVPHRSIAKLELLVKPPRGTRSLVTLRRVGCTGPAPAQTIGGLRGAGRR